MDPILIVVASGILGLLLAWFMAAYVLRQDRGTQKMQEISDAIREGAQAFLARQYRIMSIVIVIVGIILGVLPSLGWWVALAFVFGAVCSDLTGFIGMSIATRANSRTTAAAQKSLNSGLRVAFRSGAVMGMCVVCVGVLGISILYFLFRDNPLFLTIVPAFAMGASLVAVFARVGGGIYTKAADTGSDMVGKIEKGIPEDDPRNAGVIADLVGDNVGDVAGMGADLFESYVESIIATMTLSALAISFADATLVPNVATAWFLPMMVAAAGILASIIGVFFVRVGEKAEMGALLNALRRGVWTANILDIIFIFLAVYFLKADLGLFWAIMAGLVAGFITGEVTNYYTSYSYKPTAQIAESAQTGAGSVVTRGFANGLMSTLIPVILVAFATLVAFHFGGMYGVAIAGIGMLSTLGISLATDAYGPVADNAGGIAEMAELPHDVRERTDALDSLGNTTAATGKGFAIASAALTALALVLSYNQAVGIKIEDVSLLDARVIAGVFIGAMIPALFSAFALNSVSKTAYSIINEVRRQFREIKGLMEGKARPEYGRCVDICTKAALKEMMLPSIIAIVTPVLVGLVFGKVALAGFLIGSTASGFILAITMSNAGGSWDNAKKFIETGKYGGKGSDAHKAAVVGDTVGDPFKDTAGPSLNIVIKLMSVIALVLAPVLANFTGLF